MLNVVIISGLSGSGKSVALHFLEDNGFYVVDNLPASLLGTLVTLMSAENIENIAIAIDSRAGNGIKHLPAQLQGLHAQGFTPQFIFLTANNNTVIKRYSESRRRHPLTFNANLNENCNKELTLMEAIIADRDLMAPLQNLGFQIDTSDMKSSTLRTWLKDMVLNKKNKNDNFKLIFQSFGFKHGVPIDSDLLFDVRCLPNPFYDKNLRPLTGKDAAVADFLQDIPDVKAMFENIKDFVVNWLPKYLKDDRSYFTISIGCTGGQHRSVYIAERLAKYFAQQTYNVLVRHRSLD